MSMENTYFRDPVPLTRKETALRKRDTSNYKPLGVCDGHSFKAKVAHPAHGRPFKPEICAIIDAATRVVVGWSTGLTEYGDMFAMPGPEALKTEIQKFTEQESKARAEKRKRMRFLEEMEG